MIPWAFRSKDPCQLFLHFLPIIILSPWVVASSIPAPILSTVSEFINHKIGGNLDGGSPTSVWVYTGSLIDPVTGADICRVQGIELLESIGHTRRDGVGAAHRLPFSRFRRRCRPLRILKTLEPHCTDSLEQGKNSLDDAKALECHSFLSRKCFCYCTRDNKELLQSWRRRHNSPNVRIPFHQAVSCYDSVVSCVGFGSTSISKPSTWLHTERPGGKEIWSRVVYPQKPLQPSDGDVRVPLEFSIFTRRRSSPLVLTSDPRERSYNDTESFHRPHRLRLIQWGGGSSQQPSGNDFGVRETYQYVSSPSDSSPMVRYTRHGEAPVWYGPGRMCQLELTGIRIDSLRKNTLVRSIWQRSPWKMTPDGLETESVQKVDVSSHVPIVSNVIEIHLPNFWEFGICNPNSRSPQWMQCLQEKTNRSSLKQDDRDFQYYANALHSELQLDVDGSSSFNTDNRSMRNEPENILSGPEFHQFYADLTIGRRMDRFLQHPALLLPKPLMYPQQRRLFKLCNTVSSVWDKVRAATTLSIGPRQD